MVLNAVSAAFVHPGTDAVYVVQSIAKAAEAVRNISAICLMNGWDQGKIKEYHIDDYPRTKISYHNGSSITVMLSGDPGIPKDSKYTFVCGDSAYAASARTTVDGLDSMAYASYATQVNTIRATTSNVCIDTNLLWDVAVAQHSNDDWGRWLPF